MSEYIGVFGRWDMGYSKNSMAMSHSKSVVLMGNQIYSVTYSRFSDAFAEGLVGAFKGSKIVRISLKSFGRGY